MAGRRDQPVRQRAQLAPLGLTALFVLLARSLVALTLRAAPASSWDGWGVLKAWGLATVGYALVASFIGGAMALLLAGMYLALR